MTAGPTGAPWRAASSGAVAAAAALSATELGAALVPGAPSPVLALARTVIASTPTRLREVLVSSAGTADKPALLVGIVAVVLVLGALVGVCARASRAVGRAGVLLLALVAWVATLGQPGGSAGPSGLVLLAAAVLGLAVLDVLLPDRPDPRRARTPTGPNAAATEAAGPAVLRGSSGPLGRRAFLQRSGGVLAMAAGGTVIARSLAARRSVESVRAAIQLPRPGRRASAVPTGAESGVAGTTSLVTPNARFYKIDTAVGGDPQVDPGAWSLHLGGLVDRPARFTYADLLAMPQTEAWITVGCVGNDVGGGLIGTARWQGVLLADLLRAAGPRQGAAQVVGTSVDGYTGAFGLPLALDGRNALLALGMNGEPLPVAHGFPARLVVPGLYGYESAVKWLSRIDLADDTYRAFWVTRGYAKQAVFRTQSRIDVPRADSTLTRDPTGHVQVAGMAWAPHRGVTRVEVSVDSGPWRTAELAAGTLGPDTWRPWTLTWAARPGTHQLRVRATDSTGETQPEPPRGVLPDGATGWHTVAVTVR